ncbi:hypothetical protein L9F63_019191, partial [Diploptera punctata]
SHFNVLRFTKRPEYGKLHIVARHPLLYKRTTIIFCFNLFFIMKQHLKNVKNEEEEKCTVTAHALSETHEIEIRLNVLGALSIMCTPITHPTRS